MAIVITADEKVIALGKAGADIIFLMDKKRVEEDDQVKLYHIGVVSVELSVCCLEPLSLTGWAQPRSYEWGMRADAARVGGRTLRHRQVPTTSQ
jgi:hypothetical protein